MKLIDAIKLCIESSADTNQTGLTLSKTYGWRVTFQPHDREDGAVFIISKDSLNDWRAGYEWNEIACDLCAEWISDNLGDWLYNYWDGGNLTNKQVAELLVAATMT